MSVLAQKLDGLNLIIKKRGQGLTCDLIVFTCLSKFFSNSNFFLIIVILRFTDDCPTTMVKTGDSYPNLGCGTGDKPAWIVYAESKSSALTIDINEGQYVFIYLSI